MGRCVDGSIDWYTPLSGTDGTDTAHSDNIQTTIVRALSTAHSHNIHHPYTNQPPSHNIHHHTTHPPPHQQEDKLELAKSLEELAAKKGVKFILPTDVVVADKFAPDANSKVRLVFVA